jgi:hypothetical protein
LEAKKFEIPSSLQACFDDMKRVDYKVKEVPEEVAPPSAPLADVTKADPTVASDPLADVPEVAPTVAPPKGAPLEVATPAAAVAPAVVVAPTVAPPEVVAPAGEVAPAAAPAAASSFVKVKIEDDFPATPDATEPAAQSTPAKVAEHPPAKTRGRERPDSSRSREKPEASRSRGRFEASCRSQTRTQARQARRCQTCC